MQTPTKKGSFEDASTYNMELGEYDVLDKKKVKFSTTTYQSEDLLDCVRVKYLGVC